MCDVFHNLIGSLSSYSQFHGLINSVDLLSLLWHFVHTNKSAPELPSSDPGRRTAKLIRRGRSSTLAVPEVDKNFQLHSSRII